MDNEEQKENDTKFKGKIYIYKKKSSTGSAMLELSVSKE